MAWVVKNKTKAVQDGLVCVSVALSWPVWWPHGLGGLEPSDSNMVCLPCALRQELNYV